MAGKAKIGAVIALDGEKQFKDAVTSVNKELTNLKSQSALVKEQFEGQANTLEALTAKHDVLKKVLETHKKKEEEITNGLDHAKETYEDYGKKLEALRNRYIAAADKMEQMEKNSSSTTQEITEQRKVVEELRQGLEKSEKNYQTAAERVQNWETKLNTACAQTIKASRALEQNDKYLEEAQNSTDKCAASIDAYGKKVKESVNSTISWKEAIKTAVAEKGIDLLSNAFSSLFGVLKDGSKELVDITKEAAAYVDEINTTATVTRMSTRSLQAYNYAADLVDVSLETLTGAMKKNIKSMSNVQKGTEDYVNAYKKLGVTVVETDGSLRDSESVFWDCIDALGKMSDETDRDAISIQLFGKSAQDLNPLIAQGAEGIKKLAYEAESMGAILDEDALSSLNATQDSLDRLTQSSEIFRRKIGSEIAPYVENASNSMISVMSKIDDELAEFIGSTLEECVNVVKWVIEHNKEVTSGLKGVGAALATLLVAKQIAKVADAMSTLGKMTNVTTTATKAATVAQEGLNVAQKANAIGLITSLLVGTVTAIYSYTESTSKAVDETEEFIDTLKEKRDAINEGVQSYYDSIDTVENEWDANQKLIDKLLELNEVQEKTVGQKAEMQGIVTQLSEDIPELAEAYNAETGALNLTQDALDGIITKRREYALAVASQNSLQDLANEVVEAENMISETEARIKEKTDRLEQLQKSAGEYSFTLDWNENAYWFDTQKAIQETEEDISSLNTELAGYKSSYNDANAALDDAVNKSNEYADALSGVSDAAEDFSDAETSAADTTVKMTKEQIEAYKELENAITTSVENSVSVFDEFSGGTEVSAQEVLSNLRSQVDGIQNWSENMEKLAGAAGKGMSQEFYEYLSELGPQGANLVQELVDELEAGTPLFTEICQEWKKAMDMSDPIGENVTELNKAFQEQEDYYKLWQQKSQEEAAKAGKEWVKKQSEGMTEETESVEIATEGVSDSIKTAMSGVYGDYVEIGNNISKGVAEGIDEGKPEAVQAANRLSSGVMSALKTDMKIHSPSQETRDKIGIMISKGLAEGILDGIPEVNMSVADLCKAVLGTSEAELDIHSPSRVFRDRVGANISKGVAFGITAKKGEAIKSSKSLADDVYKSASKWLDSYKQTHVVSLEDEKYFWNKVAGTVKKGTTAYNKALEKAADIESFSKKMKKQIEDCFNVSEYTTNSKGEQEKKSVEDYYGDIYSAASKYFDNYSIMHDVSLAEEVYYWKQVQKQLKKGTQAYYDTTKKIKDLQSKQKQEVADTKASNKEYALSGDALAKYKTYYQVSAKAEVQYWDIVRKKYKQGTAERIEADQKYYEAKEQYNEQLEELNQEYYDNCTEVQDKLKDDIQDLTDTYNDAVKERRDSIYSSFGLFDQFESTSASGQTLLYNLKTQVVGYADWEKQLNTLQGKGILSDDLISELSAMGPEASASIQALNQLSEAELKEYEQLWEQKNALAETQAVKDNERLKAQTDSQIEELKASAQKQLDAYKVAYNDAVAEVNKAIEEPLKTLAKKATTIGEDAAAKYVAGIKNGATKKSTKADLKKVTTSISTELGKLTPALQTIGDNALQGIIDGLTNKKKIDNSAKSLISALKSSLQKAADIHSPSRLFKKEIGNNISAGVAEGIADESDSVNTAGEDMIKDLLNQSKQQLEKQQTALSEYASSVQSHVGIAELNNLISVTPVQNVTATVDNSALISMFGEMLTVMQEGFVQLGNMQIVTDTGTVIGETSAGMSEAFAMNARRLR